MLTRMVSICWPRDPPASASQSAGITGLSHCARPDESFLKSCLSKLCFSDPKQQHCQELVRNAEPQAPPPQIFWIRTFIFTSCSSDSWYIKVWKAMAKAELSKVLSMSHTWPLSTWNVLVWNEIHCKYKIHTRLWRLSIIRRLLQDEIWMGKKKKKKNF